MNEINLAILGPFIYAGLEAFKRAGLPTRYMQFFSLVLALVIAVVVAWQQPEPLAILTNAGSIYLAIEGAYKNGSDWQVKRVKGGVAGGHSSD